MQKKGCLSADLSVTFGDSCLASRLGRCFSEPCPESLPLAGHNLEGEPGSLFQKGRLITINIYIYIIMHILYYICMVLPDTVGGQPSQEGNPALNHYRKGALLMVTWSDLIQFMIMITAIATLFFTIGKRK